MSYRAIVQFVCGLAFCYAFLMAPWPGLEPTYAGGFRACADWMFRSFGSDGVVRFWPNPSAQEAHDTMLEVTNRKNGRGLEAPMSSRYEGYVPTAFLVALVLATPLPYRRRGRALVWGVVVIHCLIALKLTLIIVYLFSHDHPSALFSPSPFWRDVLRSVVRLIGSSPLTWLIMPTFVWILVTLRRGDFAAVTEPTIARKALIT